MRSLIVDDEVAARSRLGRLLAAHPDIVIAGEARDGLEAIEQIERLRPELLFLDIETPGLTGFQVLQSLQSDVALPLVIFVTGYDQHALAAFEANALAYLLKPVEPDRLALAVERARRLNATTSEKEVARRSLLHAVRESPERLRHVVCRKRDGLVLVSPEQILWFETQQGIVRARTATDAFWVNYQLVDLEASLPADVFFRARRNILVNVTQIRQIKPYFKGGFLLVMADASRTEIAVSERQVPHLRRRLPGL